MKGLGGNPNIGEYRKDYYTDKVLPKWEMIGGWCRAGVDDSKIARNLGIGRSTWCRFLVERQELADYVKECREDPQIQVENALFKRATGYSYIETTKERREVDGKYQMVTTKQIRKHVVPDVGAAQYWLEHRAVDRWMRNPVAGADIVGINNKIAGLADMIANPVSVREIGSENE